MGITKDTVPADGQSNERRTELKSSEENRLKTIEILL